MKKLDILIVEDERRQREVLRDFLAEEGHRVAEAENGEKAVAAIRAEVFHLAILDYRMPGMNGLEVLKEAKRIDPELDVIITTAYGSIETAVEAMKNGATDYLSKPIDLDELLILIDRVAERRTLIRENELFRMELEQRGVTQQDIVYASPKMAELINLAGRVAPSRAAVLIQGESGTGKELMARLIHTLSPRSGKPLVTVNCSALPESLLESELFGHEKGAFTGAARKRIGRFEQADGGTLFLDEIGDLSPSVQVKLLRFLQEGDFQRLGGDKTIEADVRVISATHRDLDHLVKEGSFREDFYYRLKVVTITVPPLRERRDDIPALIEHFIRRFSKENRKKIEGVSRQAKDLLVRYDYPGNVRELENIIERAVVICRGPVISKEDLPFNDADRTHSVDFQEAKKGNLREALEALENRMITEAMRQAESNQTKAAAALGISERMLRYKLKKYGFK